MEYMIQIFIKSLWWIIPIAIGIAGCAIGERMDNSDEDV